MSGYQEIVKHYEDCFSKHGDSPAGVDWPNLNDLLKRYEVMLGLIRETNEQINLLDFGCGTAMLKTYADNSYHKNQILYSGLDIGKSFAEFSRKKFPETPIYHLDILKESDALPDFDYTVMNGVFTEKRSLSYDEMFSYMCDVLRIVFAKSKKGIAFNVMSKAVDWERDDLFHVPADQLIGFMTKELSRHFVIRNDYGLYEYTVYLYHQVS